MPCWFYDKKDLLNTPSAKDGISAESEAWYRKEGAKHIMDAGNKLGLRFDTCATGVVYFHRFYMFHSFKEFHRLVTSACCLFLAGKVEETPKKCKDIIKTFRSMLNDSQFAHFGEDPKEEVMTLERILLQTIKFDLMVEHPYAYLLKFAKLVKGDKAKIQKMVQMAWTFINDSLCTTLCLQWEPEIVAVAVMYLTSRLNKFDIVDWQGKPLGYRGKWYEFLVDDVTLELLEDICHQVLDLYSNASQPQKDAVGSSPLPVKIRQPQISSDDDQSRTPRTPKSPHGVKRPAPSSVTNIVHSGTSGTSVPVESDLAPAAKERERAITTLAEVQSASLASSVQSAVSIHPVAPVSVPLVAAPVSSAFSVANPYIPSQMYSSSFMSSEGSQSIQTLIGTQVQVTTAPVRDDQGRPGSYAGPPAAGYSQQYGVSQSFTGTLLNQVPIAAGASATHRSEYPNSSSVGAAGNYWATSVTGGGYQGNASSTGSSYGQQSQSYQVYQQGVSESPTRAPYVAGNNQPQYPGSSSQSTSPVYMGHGEGHGRPPAFGAQTGSGGLQQQRYQSAPAQSLPAANPSYQSHPSSGASYQNQAAVGQGFHNQSTSGAPFQNQQGVPNVSYQSHSSGGYQGRALPSTGYATQQPSGGFLQSSQQSFQGRDQGSTSGYQSQLSGYQQSSSNIRSGTSGSQQQSGAPRQGGQNWGYQGHDGYD